MCVSVARADINNIMAGIHTEAGRRTKAGYTVAASYEKDAKEGPARVRHLLSTWPTKYTYITSESKRTEGTALIAYRIPAFAVQWPVVQLKPLNNCL